MIKTKYKFYLGDKVRSVDHHSEYGEITRIQETKKSGILVAVSISKYCTLIRPQECWEEMSE